MTQAGTAGSVRQQEQGTAAQATLEARINAAVRDWERLLGTVHRAVDWQDREMAAWALDDTSEEATALVAGHAPTGRFARCAEVALRLEHLRAELASSRARAVLARQAGMERALGRLQGVTTAKGLLAVAPQALRDCGFARAWTATVQDGRWRLAGGAGVPKAGSEPQPLAHTSHEAELVRRGRAVLVTGAPADRRVDAAVARWFAPRAYVAAPLVLDGRVVGFLGADHGAEDGAGEEDRQVAALFAAALAHALARVVLAERLAAVRQELGELTGALRGTVDDADGAVLELRTPAPAAGPPAVAALPVPSAAGTALERRLTRRELEVLQLLAAGRRNADIATHLVISADTVKSHVKSILRKLGAANRAQAVSRYLQILDAG